MATWTFTRLWITFFKESYFQVDKKSINVTFERETIGSSYDTDVGDNIKWSIYLWSIIVVIYEAKRESP